MKIYFDIRKTISNNWGIGEKANKIIFPSPFTLFPFPPRGITLSPAGSPWTLTPQRREGD